MQSANVFVEAAKRRGFLYWSGVPCSYLQAFINYVIADPGCHYIPSANEGDAVALACGAHLGGARAVVMLQNSGLGNAVNPLTSLAHTHRLPLLMIVTLRGEPGRPDEPQHALMGEITPALLDLMEIGWSYFPADPAAVETTLDEVEAHFAQTSLPYCLVMRKDTIAPWSLSTLPRQAGKAHDCAVRDRVLRDLSPRATRGEMLAALLSGARARDAFFATTGYTGRELYAAEDRPNHFYLVGAMGCASSLGLGFAMARPDWRAIVIDGDGALFMRMGALSTIGNQQPANLVHVVLDNGAYESTGNQATVSPSVDLAAIAAACGYAVIHDIDSAEDLVKILYLTGDGPCFVRARIRPGCPETLPRPALTPVEVAQRLRGHVMAGSRA